MKFLLIWAALVAGGVSTATGPTAAPLTQPAARASAVYVCLSKTSVAYHLNDYCPGLGRCTHPVKMMGEQEAQGLGKRACRKCY